MRLSHVLCLAALTHLAWGCTVAPSDLRYDSGVVIADADNTAPDAPPAPRTPTWIDDVQPIIAARCLACHGSPDTINPVVKAALAAKYPKDQATGFKEGDLCGWFWVEVPPPTR